MRYFLTGEKGVLTIIINSVRYGTRVKSYELSFSASVPLIFFVSVGLVFSV
jgi:hypothetical protein